MRSRFGVLSILSFLSASGSFIAFGDWGMNTSDFRSSSEHLVHYKPNFTVLLGDNFYDDGVESVNDTRWQLFLNIQDTSPLFFAVLGNHDYGGSIDSQSAYSYINPRWFMPSRYYMKLISLNNKMICAIFIDSYFFDKYQRNWLRVVLSSAPCQGDPVYRIVFGHYPIHTVGLFADDGIVKQLRKDVKPLLQEYRVHAYICGHEHDMAAFHENGVHYIISGAFSDRYEQNITKGKDPSLLFRSLNTPAFARFELRDNMTMKYWFTESRSGDTLYQNQVYLFGNWTVRGNRPVYKLSWIIYLVVFVA
jgi:hypothetical protein